MNLDSWLLVAIADAEKRGLPELKPLLEGLAKSTQALRDRGYIDPAHGRREERAGSGGSPVR
jgi:hypothetical protein